MCAEEARGLRRTPPFHPCASAAPPARQRSSALSAASASCGDTHTSGQEQQKEAVRQATDGPPGMPRHSLQRDKQHDRHTQDLLCGIEGPRPKHAVHIIQLKHGRACRIWRPAAAILPGAAGSLEPQLWPPAAPLLIAGLPGLPVRRGWECHPVWGPAPAAQCTLTGRSQTHSKQM